MNKASGDCAGLVLFTFTSCREALLDHGSSQAHQARLYVAFDGLINALHCCLVCSYLLLPPVLLMHHLVHLLV